jgi:hypothetical protein
MARAAADQQKPDGSRITKTDGPRIDADFADPM